MQNRTFPLSAFALGEFIAAFTEFYCWWSESEVDGSVAVSLLDRFGNTPTPSNEERDLTVELIDHGKLVFFPFHEPITADEIKCLDRSTFLDDEADSKIDIGVSDSYGYLVEVREGAITFYPASYDGSSGPHPSLDVQHECGVFDDQMETFLDRFVSVGYTLATPENLLPTSIPHSGLAGSIDHR